MTPLPASRSHGRAFPAAGRYPVLALTYALLKPLMWLVDKAGYSERVWAALVRQFRRRLLAGHDFGDYLPTEHDVVVCTYPKSGTNWVMQIAYQIAMRGRGEFAHIHDVVPWPDFARQDLVIPLSDDTARNAAPTGLRVIKTHLAWDRIPYTEQARYICVIRDPKDTFVSFYHFVREVMFGPLMPSVPVWLRICFSDAALFVWEEHFQSYWKARQLPNLLMLTFEDMQADLSQAVRTIAAFLEVELTADEFELVCEKSSFAYMKRLGDKFAPPALTPWSSPNRQTIRRGTSGGSAELLSPEQQRFIDAQCKAGLARLGSDFPFNEVWGEASVSAEHDRTAEMSRSD